MEIKKLATMIFAGTFIFAGTLWAAFDAAHCDEVFYHTRELDKTQAMLEKTLSEEGENAEALWRLARNMIAQTDLLPEEEKDARLAGYSQAEKYAERSLALKESAQALHWKASAIGRIGQVNGPLNSLGKAKSMRELLEKVQNDYKADSSHTWYVLSMLYSKLPGGFISFGDDDIALSYMRRAIDTQDNAQELHLRNYLELAEQLRERDLSAKKRAKLAKKLKEKFEKNIVPTEKYACYEGVFAGTQKLVWSDKAFGELSDEAEAQAVLKYALKIYENAKNPIDYETKLAQKIKSLIQ